MMTTARRVLGILWRSALIGAGYVFASMLAGMVFGILGFLPPVSDGAMASLGWLLAAGVLLGLFLGLLASRIAASFGQHMLIWTSVVFFNMGAVTLEGAFFVPELVPIPIPLLAIQQFVAACATGLLITLLFAQRNQATDLAKAFRCRPWFSWLWRILLASASYLLFYLIFGALNYALVTEPYYAAHAGGLNAPDAATVLCVELVRAPLLVLSIVPFVLAYRVPRRRSMLMTGLLLFWVGGVVPLVLQIGMLPLPLLFASAVEIFLQNFLTGVIAARLLWVTD